MRPRSMARPSRVPTSWWRALRATGQRHGEGTGDDQKRPQLTSITCRRASLTAVGDPPPGPVTGRVGGPGGDGRPAGDLHRDRPEHGGGEDVVDGVERAHRLLRAHHRHRDPRGESGTGGQRRVLPVHRRCLLHAALHRPDLHGDGDGADRRPRRADGGGVLPRHVRRPARELGEGRHQRRLRDARGPDADDVAEQVEQRLRRERAGHRDGRVLPEPALGVPGWPVRELLPPDRNLLVRGVDDARRPAYRRGLRRRHDADRALHRRQGVHGGLHVLRQPLHVHRRGGDPMHGDGDRSVPVLRTCRRRVREQRRGRDRHGHRPLSGRRQPRPEHRVRNLRHRDAHRGDGDLRARPVRLHRQPGHAVLRDGHWVVAAGAPPPPTRGFP